MKPSISYYNHTLVSIAAAHYLEAACTPAPGAMERASISVTVASSALETSAQTGAVTIPRQLMRAELLNGQKNGGNHGLKMVPSKYGHFGSGAIRGYE